MREDSGTPEPSVALVDKNTAARGTTEAASGYLEYLYSDVGQRIGAKHHYRPSKPEFASAEDRKRFPELRLATIDEVAAMAVFIASPLSSATNGAALRAEGGVIRSIL